MRGQLLRGGRRKSVHTSCILTQYEIWAATNGTVSFWYGPHYYKPTMILDIDGPALHFFLP